MAVRQVAQEVNQGNLLNGAMDRVTLTIDSQPVPMIAGFPADWEVMIDHM